MSEIEPIEDPIQKANRLRDITAKYRVLKFDPACVRKKANLGSLSSDAKFEKWYVDNPDNLIDPDFLHAMRLLSPKLHKLLKTITYLDEKDMREHGHMFKHFIFSDIKASTKLLATGLVSMGFRVGVKPIIAKSGKKEGKPNGCEILSSEELAAEKTLPGCKGHFDLMASGAVFSKAMSVVQKKQLFARFNARDDSAVYPRNNHGEQVRIIIMDNGFKEGVDLFDVKYVHIFEPQVTMADTKQVVGRGTRTCGQKGLVFDPERGWPLHVYVYDLDIGTSKTGFLEAGSAFDLYLKALNIDLRLFKLHNEMEQLMMEGSVDYELNRAVHEFKGKADKELDYSWSRTASPDIPFELLEDSVLLQGEVNEGDYIYEVANMPADTNASALLNELFGGEHFVDGQGEYATNKYRVVLDYDIVYVQFKSVQSMETIGKLVVRIGEALMLDSPSKYIEITNRETGEHIDFNYDGSSYSTVDSFASSKNKDSEGYNIKSVSSSISSDSDSGKEKKRVADANWARANHGLEEHVASETSQFSESRYEYMAASFPYAENGYKLINKVFGSKLTGPSDSLKTDFYWLRGSDGVLELFVSSITNIDKIKTLVNKIGNALKLGPEEYGISIMDKFGEEIDVNDIDDYLATKAMKDQELEGSFEGGAQDQSSLIGQEQSGTLKGGALIKFTPTQDFVSHYFTPQNPIKGMLLNHSVGTGKTCTAIATATGSFEPQGYTILWVTRTTLRNDIWKNMFDMVCHHGLMNQRDMPATQTERMKLLSKSWSIRPISYKQFTNLVTKANSYYARLVKKNGATDPLRKTLLVIDEAHKLFGGNDLSSIERPDTAKLHQALMSSYVISGDDSVRLLLMTATPITKDPLELVKLLNLCRLPDQQIPDTLGEFADTYLKEDGSFSETGRKRFLDDIAGHISYLNREKDARQFSQPVVHNIMVPFNDKKMIRSFDKQLVSRTNDLETNKLKTDIATKAYELEEHFKGFDKFMIPLGTVCDEIEHGPLKKKCISAVNKKRAELVRTVKAIAKTRRAQIKDIKKQVKKFTQSKKNKLKDIKAEAKKDSDFYKDFYMKSSYAKLASCGKVDTVNVKFNQEIASKPDIQQVDGKINHWNTVIPADIVALAARIKTERKILAKPRLQSLRFQLKERRAEHKFEKKSAIKTLKKERKVLVKGHKKTLSSLKKDAVRAERMHKKELLKMKKLARKEGEVQEIINTEIKDLVHKYLEELPEDETVKQIKMLDVAKGEKEEAKEAAKAEKAEAKKAKAEAAAEKKAEVAAKKAVAVAEKKAAVLAAKEEKARAMTLKKAEAATKKAEAAAKKTRKNVNDPVFTAFDKEDNAIYLQKNYGI